MMLSLTACARDSRPQIPVAVAASSDQPGSVWVVDSPKTGGRLFLCGTIHILREEDYPLSPAYEGAYANSSRIILELPPGAGEGASMTSRMRELGMLPAGTSLQSSLSPETWGKIQKWAVSRQVDPASLNRYRPWFVSLLITSTEYAALGAKPQLGVDQYFEARAKRDEKPAEGLETVELQLQLFAGLTAAQQQEMLEQTLAEVSTLPKEYDDMIDAWKKGDLKKLHERLFREAERFPELMDIFLFHRNQSWMAHLEALLQKGDKAMLLVGTGHFTADKGLIQLLKNKGYTVRPYAEVKDL